jgi:hypothetical protein
MLYAAGVQGCQGGKALRGEGLAIARANGSLSLEAQILDSEASCLMLQREPAAVVTLFERVVQLNDRAFGPDSDAAALSHTGVAYALAGAGNIREAVAEARWAVAHNYQIPSASNQSQSRAMVALLIAHDAKRGVLLAHGLASSAMPGIALLAAPACLSL